MNRFNYIPALAEAIKTLKPDLNVYEDFRNGRIEYPNVTLICETEEAQDWSNEHTLLTLEVIVTVEKSEENPSLPNEINEMICSEEINELIFNPVVHYLTIESSEMEREDHTTKYTTTFEVATYNNAD